MARTPPILVALDLETTGLSVEQDTILEVAAVKFQGETTLDTLEMLVNPGRPIPYRIQRLTGITSPMLVGAPSFDAIAPEVQRFIGDLPIVGHSIPFDVSFLRRRGLVRTNALIDTFELATVLLPSLASYNLGQVAEALGIIVAPGRHRAMVDTVLARDVFLALHQRLAAVDLGLLKDLAGLDAPRSWPLLAYLRQEYRQRQQQEGVIGVPARGSLGDRFAAQLGVDPRVLSFAVAREPEASPNSASNATNGNAAIGELSPRPALQTLTELQKKVEVIPEQAQQSQPLGYQTARSAVYDALEQKTPLLMEVTIGGNDYTPALLPVLEWLVSSMTDGVQSAKRLVIACSSRQSASRLIDETLPHLQTMLKSNLPVAYLAQKDGYLCLHRWFGPALRRTSGELTAEQARGLAKFALWAQQTQAGELRELNILPQETSAWGRISSGYEHIPSSDKQSGTTYERCHYRSKGYCFVSRAEARIRKATIVVTTHAGLLDDLSRPNSLLTSIERRLILDADVLEEESNRWSSAELDQTRLQELLSTIGKELPDGHFQGLLALAAPSLRENGPGGLSTTPTITKAELDARMRTWFQTLRQTSIAVDELFKSFSQLLEEYVQGNDGNGGNGGNGNGKGRGDSTARAHGGRNVERTDQPLRLTNQTRNLSAWMNVSRSWQQAAQRIQSVITLVYEAERMILTAQRGRHRLDASADGEDAAASELSALAYQLQEFKHLGQQALALNEGEKVYWLRMPPPPPTAVQQMAQQRQTVPPTPTGLPAEHYPVLYSQLVQTPAFFKKMLLKPGICTIFAGVAISVDNSFSFCRGRFGMDSDNYPALSVVTEHHEQTLLYLPTDVPEPNMPQYQRYLDDALVQLTTALEGQTVVLYTSHAALRSSYAAIKPLLESRGILVLAQGIDGSPRQLWSTFATQARVVILGTGSFWDSVGEINAAPACIVITRLPMPVLNDPPVAVRAAQYNDQLHQLTVPVAALRVRRALNRIAWNSSRRNAVVLFDRRITSKEYGSMILHTLPHCSQRQDGISHAPETILDWLTATGAWD